VNGHYLEEVERFLEFLIRMNNVIPCTTSTVILLNTVFKIVVIALTPAQSRGGDSSVIIL
jgi:hypothetical protein